jgi:hypothetical protein
MESAQFNDQAFGFGDDFVFDDEDVAGPKGKTECAKGVEQGVRECVTGFDFVRERDRNDAKFRGTFACIFLIRRVVRFRWNLVHTPSGSAANCDARRLYYDAVLAGGLGSGAVRFETVVAEAQREEAGGAAEGGVGAASVGGRNEDAAFGGSLLQDFFELPGLDEWNVGGDHEGKFIPALFADASGHFDGAGFTGICGIGDDFELILGSELYGEGIAGDEGHGGAVAPFG